MTADGKAVVFISHKLGEVLEIADRVTVMRDGRVTGDVATAATNREELARMMVGRDVDLSARRATAAPGDAVLRVADLTLTRGDATLVDDIGSKTALWARTDLPFDPAGFFGAVDHPDHVLVRIAPTRADRKSTRLNSSHT